VKNNILFCQKGKEEEVSEVRYILPGTFFLYFIINKNFMQIK